ncbi:hypothetical protein LY76DRAFT_240028 [Colletotrichum caudatum]|nr:hypothetical protein LY76DRAFT_240028 [Colletotrichum caudatum]
MPLLASSKCHASRTHRYRRADKPMLLFFFKNTHRRHDRKAIAYIVFSKGRPGLGGQSDRCPPGGSRVEHPRERCRDQPAWQAHSVVRVHMKNFSLDTRRRHPNGRIEKTWFLLLKILFVSHLLDVRRLWAVLVTDELLGRRRRSKSPSYDGPTSFHQENSRVPAKETVVSF